MFYNFWGLVTVVLSILISYFIYRKELPTQVVTFAQLLVWIITLISLVIGLSRINEMQVLGSLLSFVILSNLYISIINIGVRLQRRIS
jgi:hypothetical protein